MPEDFELRWDVKLGIADAMRRAIEVGLVEKTYDRGGSWRYTGLDLAKIEAALEKEKRARQNKLNRAVARIRKKGIKIDSQHRYIKIDYDNFMKLAGLVP